jgi:hypothetical protein
VLLVVVVAEVVVVVAAVEVAVKSELDVETTGPHGVITVAADSSAAVAAADFPDPLPLPLLPLPTAAELGGVFCVPNLPLHFLQINSEKSSAKKKNEENWDVHRRREEVGRERGRRRWLQRRDGAARRVQ